MRKLKRQVLTLPKKKQKAKKSTFQSALKAENQIKSTAKQREKQHLTTRTPWINSGLKIKMQQTTLKPRHHFVRVFPERLMNFKKRVNVRRKIH